jgi:hypothetical protein
MGRERERERERIERERERRETTWMLRCATSFSAV